MHEFFRRCRLRVDPLQKLITTDLVISIVHISFVEKITRESSSFVVENFRQGRVFVVSKLGISLTKISKSNLFQLFRICNSFCVPVFEREARVQYFVTFEDNGE